MQSLSLASYTILKSLAHCSPVWYNQKSSQKHAGVLYAPATRPRRCSCHKHLEHTARMILRIRFMIASFNGSIRNGFAKSSVTGIDDDRRVQAA